MLFMQEIWLEHSEIGERSAPENIPDRAQLQETVSTLLLSQSSTTDQHPAQDRKLTRGYRGVRSDLGVRIVPGTPADPKTVYI